MVVAGLSYPRRSYDWIIVIISENYSIYKGGLDMLVFTCNSSPQEGCSNRMIKTLQPAT